MQFLSHIQNIYFPKFFKDFENLLKPQLHCHGSDDNSPRTHTSWWILVNTRYVIKEFVMISHDPWSILVVRELFKAIVGQLRFKVGAAYPYSNRKAILHTRTATVRYMYTWQFLVFPGKSRIIVVCLPWGSSTNISRWVTDTAGLVYGWREM